MAEALAASGAKVVLAGRTLATLEETCASIEARGGIFQNSRTSGRKPTSRPWVMHHWRATGRLMSWSTTPESTRSGARSKGRGSGAVINVSSIAGHVGLARSVPYCASKGGLELMTRDLALDWADAVFGSMRWSRLHRHRSHGGIVAQFQVVRILS